MEVGTALRNAADLLRTHLAGAVVSQWLSLLSSRLCFWYLLVHRHVYDIGTQYKATTMCASYEPYVRRPSSNSFSPFGRLCSHKTTGPLGLGSTARSRAPSAYSKGVAAGSKFEECSRGVGKHLSPSCWVRLCMGMAWRV